MCGTKGIRSQFLGIADDGDRMPEIIQRLKGDDVEADAQMHAAPPELRESTAAFVSGYIKRDDPLSAEPFQRLVDGGALLLFKIHVLLDRSFLHIPVQNAGALHGKKSD